VASAPPADVLVGRDDELAVLDGLVAGLRDGRGRVVWVEGEPGIGKSALIGQVSAQAERVGCRVFQAGAD
jgi:predicted ATPase